MRDLIGAKNFPYFSVAIGQLLGVGYYHLFLACGVLSLLHLAGEWLYLGKYPHRLWLTLLLGLWLGGVTQFYWIQPELKQLHRLQFTQADQRDRELAGRAYRIWKGISEALNGMLLAGLGVYLWRLGNPVDDKRRLNASKFRS